MVKKEQQIQQQQQQDAVTFNFPLFDLLTNKTKDEVLSQEELMDYVQNIRKMDKNGFNLIFVIIRIYSIKFANTTNVNDLPFAGQRIEESKLENKTDVKFDIRNFPNKLNQMLYYFTKMHLNLIKSENEDETETEEKKSN